MSVRNHRRLALARLAAVESLEGRRLLTVAPTPIASSGRVVVGDFNDDGISDVAAAGDDAIATVRLGTSIGTFRAPKVAIPGGRADGIAAADFDLDHHLDLVAVRANVTTGTGSLVRFIGRGDGQLTLTNVDLDVNNPTAVIAADLNNDGKADLAFATSSNRLEIRLGNGDGTFGDAKLYDSLAPLKNLAAVDFNGDGKVDIVATAPSVGAVEVFPGLGDGTFPSVVQTQVGAAVEGLAVGDFDGDTKIDVATAGIPTGGTQQHVYVLKNRGFNTVSAASDTQLPTTRPVSGLVAADFNGDGKLDLAYDTAFGFDNVDSTTMAFGNGDGTFGGSSGRAAPLSPIGLGATPPKGGRSLLVIPYGDNSTVLWDGQTGIDPVLLTGGSVAAVQSVPFTGTLGSFTDATPGTAAGRFSAWVEWGDSTRTDAVVTVDPLRSGTYLVTATHTYAQPGSFLARVVVSKTGGTIVQDDAKIQVAPAALVPTGTAITAVQGHDIQGVFATFTDPANYPVADYNPAQIHWGFGLDTYGAVSSQVVDGKTVYTVDNTQLDTTYQTTPGTYPITVTISDKHGRSIVVNDTLTVMPAALHANGLTTHPTFVQGRSLTQAVVATFTLDSPRAVPGDFKIGFSGDVSASNAMVTATDFPATPTTEAFTLFTVTADLSGYFTGPHTLNISIEDTVGGSKQTVTDTVDVLPIPLTVIPPQYSVNVPIGASLAGRTLMNFTQGGAHTNADFTATIEWGDGASSAGAIDYSHELVSIPELPPIRQVSGEHVYTSLGTFNVKVTIRSIDGQTASAVTAVTIRPVSIRINGILDAASDSGASNSDGITNVTLPIWRGLTAPGATVTLFAKAAGGTVTTVGTTKADDRGGWAVMPANAFADGRYEIGVAGVDAVTGDLATMGLAPLTVDTVGPRVTSASLNPKNGKVSITFEDDRSGLTPQVLLGSNTYTLTRVGVRVGGVYSPAKLSSTSAAAGAQQVGVGMTFVGGRRVVKGNYVLAVRPGAVTDIAGNGLDGKFSGAFPSDNGTPGGTFAARVTVNGNSARLGPVIVAATSLPSGPKKKPR